MQTASDTNAIRNLHFPSRRPLSVLGQLFLVKADSENPEGLLDTLGLGMSIRDLRFLR